MNKIKLDTIEEAIEDFRKGEFVIVVDDEDRENEGDLIIAAELITPEKVNFMLKHARGVLCAPITISRCKELDLPHQVSNNTSVLGTPFTVTVDKLEGCSTGVSAVDRAATIRALADPASTPETFGRPGHINPLYAQDKGVLRRAGHTEACIDMAKLAGLYPAGALMEVMNEDGTMARLPELRKMADEYGFKLISIADLIAYRLKQESLVEKGVEADFDKIEEDIIIRDRQDMEREIAPLKQAEDAVLVDSSDMTIEEVVDAIVAEFEKVKLIKSLFTSSEDKDGSYLAKTVRVLFWREACC